MTDKAPDAYRTISEVAEDIDLPQHVLRFWETRFGQIKPLKRGGGRRYYRPDDVELLKGIRFLLYGEGYTIKGVQRILKEQGPKAVQALVKSLSPAEFTTEEAPAQEMTAAPAPQPVAAVVTAPPVRPIAPQPPPAAPVASSMPDHEPELPPIAPLQPAWPEPVFHAPPRAMPERDLFEPAPTAPAVAPLPPLEPPPAPPVRAAANPANISFMRGGLSKPVIPERVPLARTLAIPAPAPAPPPVDPVHQPRYAPIVEAKPAVDLPPLPVIHDAIAPRSGLSSESRRLLQSALFELTECRRIIERITVARAR